MTNFINLEKCSKKERKAYYDRQRGSWNGVKPVTRVNKDRKKADRRNACRKKGGEW